MNKYKIVFVRENNTYELWVKEFDGEWKKEDEYVAELNELLRLPIVSEELLWDMHTLDKSGYEYIGLEES